MKRLLAGRPVRLDGQVLDADLQLLGRVADALASSDGGTVDQATLAEQRRQAARCRTGRPRSPERIRESDSDSLNQ